MKRGDKVRIVGTREDTKFGAMSTPESSRFCADVIAGTVGTYYGPHSNPELANWYIVAVDHDDWEGPVYVPLHESQIEAVK